MLGAAPSCMSSALLSRTAPWSMPHQMRSEIVEVIRGFNLLYLTHPAGEPVWVKKDRCRSLLRLAGCSFQRIQRFPGWQSRRRQALHLLRLNELKLRWLLYHS